MVNGSSRGRPGAAALSEKAATEEKGTRQEPKGEAIGGGKEAVGKLKAKRQKAVSKLKKAKRQKAKMKEAKMKKYFVEKVLDKRENTMEYEVRWAGCRPTDTSWEHGDTLPVQLLQDYEAGRRGTLPYEKTKSGYRPVTICNERLVAVEFKVKWRDYDLTEATWENKERLTEARQMVLAYEAEQEETEEQDAEEEMMEEQEDTEELQDTEEHKDTEEQMMKPKIAFCACEDLCHGGVCGCRRARLDCGDGCGCRARCSNGPVDQGKVEVRPSKVHGVGCFAVKDLERREVIQEYTGSVVLPWRTADPNSVFVAQVDPAGEMVVDGRVGGSAVTRANTGAIVKRGKGKKAGGGVKQNNAKFVYRKLRLEKNSRLGLGVFVVATKKIRKSEEILIDYGKATWKILMHA